MPKETNRYWLIFSNRLSKQSLIWRMSQKFNVVFNIRNASITDQVGLIVGFKT
jgi:L-aspartate semialdehyde sulfurtransferase ferredoxin